MNFLKCFLLLVFYFASITETFSRTYYGYASWYGLPFHGRKTASGSTFDMNALTAAHRSFAFGTKVKVINLANNRSVILTITDRGPFKPNRIIDVSKKAAELLGFIQNGLTRVRIEVLKDPNDDNEHVITTENPAIKDLNTIKSQEKAKNFASDEFQLSKIANTKKSFTTNTDNTENVIEVSEEKHFKDFNENDYQDSKESQDSIEDTSKTTSSLNAKEIPQFKNLDKKEIPDFQIYENYPQTTKSEEEEIKSPDNNLQDFYELNDPANLDVKNNHSEVYQSDMAKKAGLDNLSNYYHQDYYNNPNLYIGTNPNIESKTFSNNSTSPEEKSAPDKNLLSNDLSTESEQEDGSPKEQELIFNEIVSETEEDSNLKYDTSSPEKKEALNLQKIYYVQFKESNETFIKNKDYYKLQFGVYKNPLIAQSKQKDLQKLNIPTDLCILPNQNKGDLIRLVSKKTYDSHTQIQKIRKDLQKEKIDSWIIKIN